MRGPKQRHPVLDETNQRLLAELVDNPRIGMSALARRVGMSSPAVTERVRRMESEGIIRGYRVDLDPEALGLPIMAIVRVRPTGGQLSKIAKLAEGMPEITECHRITGEDCFIFHIHAETVASLETTLDQFLRYGQTASSVVVTTTVQPRGLPLVD